MYKEIPEFINKIFENGAHDKMNELLGNPKGTLLDGFHYGFEEDGTRKYIMGYELPKIKYQKNLPYCIYQNLHG